MRTLLILICCMNQLFAQDLSVEKRLFDQYEKYRETSISDRRFKHVDIQSLLLKLKKLSSVSGENFGSIHRGTKHFFSLHRRRKNQCFALVTNAWR